MECCRWEKEEWEVRILVREMDGEQRQKRGRGKGWQTNKDEEGEEGKSRLMEKQSLDGITIKEQQQIDFRWLLSVSLLHSHKRDSAK